jgi:hypothetical protein
MRTLVQKFNAYAMIVLATLTALYSQGQDTASRMIATRNEVSQMRQYFQDIFISVEQRLNVLGNNVNALLDQYGQISIEIGDARRAAIAAAKVYTDQAILAVNSAIAGLDFSVFGGRTKDQWETYISNTVGTALTAEESRVKALKEQSEIRVVKLGEYTGDIAYSAIAFPSPIGENTTHLFKFEAPLGVTQAKRNVTGLPASVNGATSIEVDNGDEMYVIFKADGTVSILTYDDNEAAVVAAVLSTQATHGGAISGLESDVTALGASFDAQAALVQSLLDQINGYGSYYYADGGGIGTGQLG